MSGRDLVELCDEVRALRAERDALRTKLEVHDAASTQHLAFAKGVMWLRLEAALAAIVAEADAYRAEHPSGADPDYASGLLSAVHDVCEAAGLPWPVKR